MASRACAPLLRGGCFYFHFTKLFFFKPDSIDTELFTSVPPTEPTQGESCTAESSSIPESSNVVYGYESQPGSL